jgi:hypothetical protein
LRAGDDDNAGDDNADDDDHDDDDDDEDGDVGRRRCTRRKPQAFL